MGAFGKNEEDLKRIDPYNSNSFQQRRQALIEAKENQRSKGGGGGGGSRFSNVYKPSTDTYDLIRVIPGSYDVQIGHQNGDVETMNLEYYTFVDHYHAGLKKSSICSGGPLNFSRTKRSPCIGCDIHWGDRETDSTGKKRSPMGRSEKYVFNVVHMVPHHKTASVDRNTGKVRKNEETGAPYYEWTACTGRGCAGCKANAETRPGHRKHWAMGSSHFNMLTGEAAMKIASSCANCGGRKSIETQAWICRGCGDAVIDIQETSLSDAEIERMSLSRVKCPHCAHTDYLEEVIGCSGCSYPRRATIFDADIELKRASTGQGDVTVLVMGDYFIRPLDPKYAEAAQPMDLPKLYAPTPMEVQERLYETRDGNQLRAGAVAYTRSR